MAISVQAEDRSTWVDTETTTALWTFCSLRDISSLTRIINEMPEAVHARSADGRGALFWAYEFGFTEGIELLEGMGADPNAQDSVGTKAKDLKAEAPQPSAKKVVVDDFFDDQDEDFFA